MEALQEAWGAIHDEWIDGLQPDEYDEIKELTAEINLYTFKCNTIRTIVQLWRTMWHMPEHEEILAFCIGFPIDLDPTDKVAYEQSLEEALGHAARFFTEAEALKTQLPEPPAAGTTKKITREYFDREIVALSRYNKYKISKHDTTGGEFVAMVQDMRRGIAAMSKTQDN